MELNELIYRELYVFLAARPDVLAIRFFESEIDLKGVPRTETSSKPNERDPSVTVQLKYGELAPMWPELERGASSLALGRSRDLPELACFILLDTHLDEAVNSLREPGPRGFRYHAGLFEAW